MAHVQLNESQQTLLARLAEVSGRSPADVLDEALRAFAHEGTEHEFWMKAQEETLRAAWDNDDDAVYDRL